MNETKQPRVLRRVRLGPRHVATGHTRHFVYGALMPRPIELRIVQYAGYPGCYFFYCDSSGEEMIDTWHESLGGAVRQAEWEFCVGAVDWEVCG